MTTSEAQPMRTLHAGLLTWAELLALGATPQRIRELIACGCLRRLFRGAYARTSPSRCAVSHHGDLLAVLPFDPSFGWPEAVLRSRAAVAADGLAPSAVFSHRTAAALYGLPLLGRSTTLEIVRPDTRRFRTRGDAVTRPSRWPDLAPQRRLGLRVQPAAHTAIDLVADHGADAGFVALEAALARGVTMLDEVLQRIDDGLRLSTPTRALVRHLAGMSTRDVESPGESLTRLRIDEAGLPQPVPQLVIRDGTGRFVARVDGGWPEQMLVYEFDGHAKYGGADGRAALAAEKAREDELRALGYGVVRVIWRDLTDFSRIRGRLESGLGQSGARCAR